MAREDAINTLKENLCGLCAYGSQNMESCDIRGCDNREAIKTLEQESCEDLVNRQAVFETIDDCNKDGLKGIFCSYDDGERFKEYIKKLPSVTPSHIDLDGLKSDMKALNCGYPYGLDYLLDCLKKRLGITIAGAEMESEE